MRHAWSPASVVDVSFCYECGLLRAGSSFLFPATERAAQVDFGETEPGCTPDRKRRTVRGRAERHRARAELDELAELTTHRDPDAPHLVPLTRVQWRELADVARLVHVSRYVDGGPGPYGRGTPRTWCGLELSCVSWTTERLYRETEVFEPGDALCSDCGAKVGQRDKSREVMLPCKA